MGALASNRTLLVLFVFRLLVVLLDGLVLVFRRIQVQHVNLWLVLLLLVLLPQLGRLQVVVRMWVLLEVVVVWVVVGQALLLLLLLGLLLLELIVLVVVVVVVAPVSGRPGHFVLLLEAPPGVREPGAHLGQRHARDHGQEDLLVLGRVGVALVVVEPLLQHHRGLSGGVLAARLHVGVRPAVRLPEQPEEGGRQTRQHRVGERARRRARREAHRMRDSHRAVVGLVRRRRRRRLSLLVLLWVHLVHLQLLVDCCLLIVGALLS